MKTYSIFLMVLVLTAALFTGCGCRNSQPMNTSMPTMPSMTTAPTTMPTTKPTTAETEPSVMPTIEDGNGPLPTNATAGPDGSTDDTTPARNRSRSDVGRNYSTAPTGDLGKMPQR